MAETRELLWRGLPGVRRTERDRFLFFFLLAALLSLGEVLGLAGSEALFLTRLGSEKLPEAFILASLTTLVGSLLYAAVVGRTRNDRLFVVMLVGSALVLLAGFPFLDHAAGPLIIGLFCAYYFSQAVFVSLHFWTFAADYFDTLASKRLLPLLAVGASLGGMVGGGLAALISRLVSGEALILAWAMALLAAAIHIRAGRARLLRWAPVGAAEADESSVEGLRGAIRYLSRSRLASWLVLSVIGMVFALTLMQFMYLDIFSQEFDTAEKLASFFGIYLAVTNGIEILVGNVFTPWLIRRFGVAQANLAHPLMTVVTFIALAIDPRLWVAVLARANEEMLENALAGPIRALSYNALPRRFRGRMRALLEGVVFFAAMSIAGVVLMVMGSGVSPLWLAAIGGGAALLYAGANLAVRREYLRSLVEELRHGRLDLADVAGGLGTRELEGLARLWESTLEEERERISVALLDLARPLAARGFVEAVQRQVDHPDPRVRRACLAAIAESGDEATATLLGGALSDAEPSVRAQAARLAAPFAEDDSWLRERLVARLEDEDLETRAEAAAALGAAGLEALQQMLQSSDGRSVVAALERMPPAGLDDARTRLGSEDPAVHAAAIDCLCRLGGGDAIPAGQLVSDLRQGDATVRRSAAAALSRRTDELAIRALAEALDDVSRAVRLEAQRALASMGDAGVLAAGPYCRGARVWTVDAALCTLAEAGGSVADALLHQSYVDRVREAWASQLAMGLCARVDTLEARFLRAALHNAHQRALYLAFRILELTEDEAVVRSIVRALDLEPSRSRADALEVLSNLGDRDTSARLALLLEDDPLEDKLAALNGFVAPPRGMPEIVEAAYASQDRWLRLAAARYGESAGIAQQSGAAAPAAGFELSTQEKEIMERLLALQNVPLFTHLSLEQLEVINQLLQEVQYLGGEIILREGEPGHELYILVEGEVEFWKAHKTPAELKLGTMSPVGYFGEIAILDNEPRAATVIASQDSRFLTLGGPRFKELILQAPEISFEVFPVLIARIRTAESRLTDRKAES
jgi:HEAT repeat protein